MKATINGTRYDTEKAIDLGFRSSDNFCNSDPSAWAATLYKNPRSDQYFLAGQGGAMTIFGTKFNGMLAAGEKIIPLTKSHADWWLTKYIR